MLYLIFLFLFGFSISLSANTDLTLIHTNDIHAHLLPANKSGQDCTSGSDCLGGLARLKTLIDQERTRNPQILFLNAGDSFSGTPFYTFHKDVDFIFPFQQLRFDTITLGNHEFADTPDVLEHFLKHISTPIVNTHVQYRNNDYLNTRLKSSVVLTKNNLKIGVLGALTPDIATSSMHGNTVTLSPVIPALKSEIERLQAQGISIFILLSHLGLRADKELAQNLPEIDIIIGGHTHQLLSNSITADEPYPIRIQHPNDTQTLIVTAGSFGRYAGKLTTTFNNRGEIISYTGDTFPLTLDIPENKDLSDFITSKSQELDGILNVKLATLDHAVSLTPDKNYCAENCAIGSAIAQMALSENPLADIVLINSGAIRSGFETGNLLLKHLIQAIPFDSTAIQTSMTGLELKQYLEKGLETYQQDTRTNSALQIAGASYQFNPVTRQIENLNYHHQPVTPTQKFQIIIPLFLAQGGDKFPPITDYKILPKTMQEMAHDYLLKTHDIPTLYPTFFLSKQ